MAHKPIDYYDEEKWGEQILTKDELFDREKKAIKLLLEASKKNAKLLDIGCGVGFFLDKLSERVSNLELHGVDYSPYNLKKAKKLGIKVKRCNIEEGIPYKDGYFEIVYAAEVIEHLINPDFFLMECHRLLGQKGKIIITTPNLCAWYNRIIFLLGVQPLFYESSTLNPRIGAGPLKAIKQGRIPVGHIRIFTLRALKDLLESQGFKVLEVKGAHFAALPGWIRWVDDLFTLYPRLSSGMVVLAEKK